MHKGKQMTRYKCYANVYLFICFMDKVDFKCVQFVLNFREFLNQSFTISSLAGLIRDTSFISLHFLGVTVYPKWSFWTSGPVRRQSCFIINNDKTFKYIRTKFLFCLF